MDIWNNLFRERVVRHWQRVPKAVVESPSLGGFKSCPDVTLGDVGSSAGLDDLGGFSSLSGSVALSGSVFQSCWQPVEGPCWGVLEGVTPLCQCP